MIKIELESNTVAEMTETLKSLLATLTGTVPETQDLCDKVPTSAAPKPTPKAAPKPTPKAAPKPTPEPEPEQAPEDDVLGGEPSPERTPEEARDEATARAQKLVGDGKSSAVRAALDSVKKGAKVSTLSDTEVFAFLKALG